MRVFVALTLPEDTVCDLEAVQARLPRGRPVPPENLHLTLAFLGDQPVEVIEAVHEGLSDLRASPFTIDLSQPALFGGARGQALGLEADGGAHLHELHDRVRSRVRGAGAQIERRRFRPHVTLARLSGRESPAPLLAALTGTTIGPVLLTQMVLVASLLRPEGAEYDVLAAYPLT